MGYFLYSSALALAIVVTLPYWLYQTLRHGKYRRGFAARWGKVPAQIQARGPDGSGMEWPTIWIHAVSVGEVLAIGGLVSALARAYPDHHILVSTTTDSGQDLARQRFGGENVFYFPMDFAFSIRPYLRALRPELVVLAETEFWPNFLRLAHASGARVALVNGRISNRSWPRYRRFPWALKRMLANIDLFLVQTEADSERLDSIGADASRMLVTGNLKFDVSLPPAPPIVESLRRQFAAEGAHPVVVAGSTVEDEERPLVKAFENLRVGHPRAVMILAPRHPERFDSVAILLEQLGIQFFRRSLWAGEDLAGRVLLVDTIGELAALYALADVAFVGGSLVPRGGHNILEPAQHGVAIMTGEHTENFRDIIALFEARDAVRIVGVSELPLTLMHLVDNDAERLGLGKRARETVRSQTGATSRTLEALSTLLNPDRQVPASAEAAHND